MKRSNLVKGRAVSMSSIVAIPTLATVLHSAPLRLVFCPPVLNMINLEIMSGTHYRINRLLGLVS